MPRDGRRITGFFEEMHDAILGIHLHHAEAGGLEPWHLEHAHRHVGPLVYVLLQHQLVIHFVHVVAREDHHELRTVGLDDVEVLVDGVGGPLVPLGFTHAL